MCVVINSTKLLNLTVSINVKVSYVPLFCSRFLEVNRVFAVDQSLDLLFLETDQVSMVVHQEVEVGKTLSSAHLVYQLAIRQLT